jgi:hypothetical protein
MGTEAEVYRLNWQSSFHGRAVVRIGQQGDQIVLRATYHPYDFITGDFGSDLTLTMSDWRRLQDALVDASFWALDVRDDRIGFDGATWTIEGRRKEICRIVERWCPGGAIWHLGPVFFDLAGLTHIEI